MTEKDKNYHRFYTDGACSMNPGPGGWGVVWIDPKDKVKEFGGHEPMTTNNEMELKAIVETLKLVSNIQEKSEILTDSQYVIKGVNQWMYGWSKNGWKNAQGEEIKNLNLWKEIYQFISNQSLKSLITWSWVKGHSGDVGNDRADAIAVSYSQNQVPEKDELNFNQPTSKKKYPVYLSYIGGTLKEHQTWSECESAVKGQSGAKFKKVKTAIEEEKILKQWNVK